MIQTQKYFHSTKRNWKKSIGNTANECTKWNNWKHCFLFFITNIGLATFIFRLFHVFRTFLQWAICETKKSKPFMTEISLANKEFLSYSRNYEIWNWCTTDALMLCQFWNLGRSFIFLIAVREISPIEFEELCCIQLQRCILDLAMYLTFKHQSYKMVKHSSNLSANCVWMCLTIL